MPPRGKAAMTFLLPLGLAFLMFVVGLRLSGADLAACLARPRALLVGLAAQLVALPALALVWNAAFGLSGALAAGLIVVAAAPGGITSNYAALLARGDLALSTAMTLATSLAAFLTVPAVLTLSGAGAGAGAPLAAMAGMSAATALICAAPLALGMAARRFAPRSADRAQSPLDRLGRIVFAALVAATFWENRATLVAHAGTVGPAVVALNLSGLAAAAALTRLAGLGAPQRAAIMVETGLQNVAMALFVTQAMGGGGLAIPALLYAVAMNVSALGLIAAGRRGWL